MTETLVVDYSFSHPAPDAIKAAGYVGVMRYLSPDPAKNLTGSELDALHGVGLAVGLVWEAGAQDMMAGSAGSGVGAVEAATMARGLAWPAGRPVFFAADWPATPADYPAIAAYLTSADQASVYPVGIYGDQPVVDTMLAEGIVRWGWQTSAWSGQSVSHLAQLYQRRTPTRVITGAGPGTFDENVALAADWGGWAPGTAPPAPAAAPGPGVTSLAQLAQLLRAGRPLWWRKADQWVPFVDGQGRYVGPGFLRPVGNAAELADLIASSGDLWWEPTPSMPVRFRDGSFYVGPPFATS